VHNNSAHVLGAPARLPHAPTMQGDEGGPGAPIGQPDAPPPHAPRRHAGGCWIVLPGIITTLGHLIFVSLLLSKWEALEHEHGSALNFSSIDAAAIGYSAPQAGPSWFAVFAPSWIAEAVVCAMALCTVAMLPLTAHNLRLLHINSMAQSMLCAVFQLLFAFRLTVERGSWLLVFSPWYMAMATQISLHYRKMADARGRRPGFPIGILHLLALVVSFKLEGVFNYSSSSWANVLWPLWGVAGFFLLSLTFGLCCGLPCLLRRDAHVRCHLMCMFSALLLLLCSVVLPALLAAVRLTLWLDGDSTIRSRDILVPYLIAVSIVLLLLCVSLAIVSFSSAVRARGGLGAADGSTDSDDDGIAEIFSSLPAPTALVRESSTLFRRVSSATMDKWEQRHQPNDSLLARHRECEERRKAGGGTPGDESEGSAASADSAIELGELRPRHALEAAAAASAMQAGASELADIRVDRPVPEPNGATATQGGGGGATDGQGERPLQALGTDGVRPDGKLLDEDGDDEDGLGGDLCWICCQGEREVVILECGHGGICFACAERCARKRPPLCPMCRTRITQIVRIAGPAEVVDGEVLVQTASASPLIRGATSATSSTATSGALADSEAVSTTAPSSTNESDEQPLIR